MRVRVNLHPICPWFVHYEHLILNENICGRGDAVAEFVQSTVLFFELHLFHLLKVFCSLFLRICPTLILLFLV